MTKGSMCRDAFDAASAWKVRTPASEAVSSDLSRVAVSMSPPRVTTGPSDGSSSSRVPSRTPRARVTLMRGARDGASSPASSPVMTAGEQPQRSARSVTLRFRDSRRVVSLLPIEVSGATGSVLSEPGSPPQPCGGTA